MYYGCDKKNCAKSADMWKSPDKFANCKISFDIGLKTGGNGVFNLLEKTINCRCRQTRNVKTLKNAKIKQK